MTPLEILIRYQGNISLIDDCVLQMVSMAGQHATVQQIVTTCAVEEIASPATVHKALKNLAEQGLVKSVKHPTDTDNRKRWIAPTALGLKRTKEWA